MNLREFIDNFEEFTIEAGHQPVSNYLTVRRPNQPTPWRNPGKGDPRP